MEFVLVRHVETINNVEHRFNGWQEAALTERGLQVREKLLNRLEKNHHQKPFERILTSPILRAKEMAEDFSKMIGVPVETENRLREFNFGVFEGLTAQEAAVQYPELWQAWMEDYSKVVLSESGSFTEFHEDLGQWLKNFDMTSDERIVLFTHGGTMNSLLLHLLGFSMTERWRFAIDPGGMAIIDAPDGYGFLRTLYSPNIEDI